MYTIKSLGWNSFYQDKLSNRVEKDLIPARVAVENKNNFILYTEYGEIPGEVSGRLLFTSDNTSSLPKVGDWVLVDLYDNNTLAIINEVMPRRTKLSRKVAGNKSDEQIIASNIDTIFIVQSADETFNLNRIERYLVAVKNSGANPVVLLSKSDLCDDVEGYIESTKNSAHTVDVFAISVKDTNSIEVISTIISEGETIALIGPSGVGKSTLINELIGEERQSVNEVRLGDSKGKHTTTKRELIMLPGGGLIIDTPGMREFQLWSDDVSLNSAFPEIDSLSEDCKYKDCSHIHEAGCAVLDAVNRGIIKAKRYANYLKMRKELTYLENRINESARSVEKKKWKSIHKEIKRFHKNGDKRR